ncbi:MAG: hypothetical protein ACR2GO_05290 [Candidatus Limnocylindria bacterium]
MNFEHRSIRIQPQLGHAHPHDAPYQLGDVWDIPLQPTPSLRPPHVEDLVLTGPGRRIDRLADVGSWIMQGVTPWRGSATAVFDATLRRSESGRAFVGREGIPSGSVGFWLPDRPLVRAERGERPPHYVYTDHDGLRWRFSYAGAAPSLRIVPARSLVRLSLARWWAPDDGSLPEACYAQVSGWYPIDAEATDALASPQRHEMPAW